MADPITTLQIARIGLTALQILRRHNIASDKLDELLDRAERRGYDVTDEEIAAVLRNAQEAVDAIDGLPGDN